MSLRAAVVGVLLAVSMAGCIAVNVGEVHSIEVKGLVGERCGGVAFDVSSPVRSYYIVARDEQTVRTLAWGLENGAPVLVRIEGKECALDGVFYPVSYAARPSDHWPTAGGGEAD